MKVITKDKFTFTFSKKNTPVEIAKPGERILFETLDCFSNTLIPEGTKLGVDNPKQSNPITGPLFIEGAEAGDTLVVHICEIQVGEVAICGSGKGLSVFEDLEDHQIKRCRVVNNKIQINDKINTTIQPMIGTIGVAPIEESQSSGLADIHGGNMDCSKIKQGSTVYLPVFNKGALLSIGDIHALMGDGEVCECGAEIDGKVIISVEVVKNTNRQLPAILSDNKWITISSEKTGDLAIKNATKHMYYELTENAKIESYEAARLLTLMGNIAINVASEYYMIARMEFPIEILELYNFEQR